MRPSILEMPLPHADQGTSYRFVVLGVMSFLTFSAGLNMFAVGPVMPMIINHYEISYGVAGLLISITFLVHLLAIPVSQLVAYISLKKLIFFGGFLNSVTLLTFLAADSFPFLLTIRGIFGCGLMLHFISSGSLFLKWFNPKERPFASGMFTCGVVLGITVASFIAGPLAQIIGWKATLSIFGGVSVLSTVSWLILGRDGERVKPNRGGHVLAKILIGVKSRDTLLVTLADLGPLCLLTACFAWLPTFYSETYGFSLVKAGSLMGVMSLAGFISLLAATVLGVRFARRRPFLIVPGVLIGFSGFGSFLLTDSTMLYVAIVALGFSTWFYLPGLMTIPMDLYPDDPRRIALIFGTLMAFGGIASFAVPWVVGVITDITGSFLPGLFLFAILSWSLLVSGILLPETGSSIKRLIEQSKRTPPNTL